MNKSSNKIRVLCTAAVTGAAYAVMTIALAPISYGALQFRVSEVLCILPFFIPGTVWGLFAGCILANLLTGNIFDIIFGSLATLLAGLCTAAFGKRSQRTGSALLACLMPVVFNAVVVGAVITSAYNGLGLFSHPAAFALNAAQVGLGEAAVLFIIGLPMMYYLPGMKFFREFTIKLND